MTYDVIIVGGSYAGLSAALQLVRARRRILILDEGIRRNRNAATSHGFFGQDGRAPGDIVADARAQVMAYDTADWIEGRAISAAPHEGGFAVATADGARHSAQRLILATGVIDMLPEVPGLAERWGRSVFHCPYCHGYELGDGPIGVIASMHHALMLPDWGPTTFFLNGAFTPDADEIAHLERRGAVIEPATIARIRGERADVELTDGRVIPMAGLFTVTRTMMASPLAQLLGCDFEDSPLGAFIPTNGIGQTSVPGVFACGDAARAAGSIALAVGDGALAGIGAHKTLMFGLDDS
jgi:thioredoxin reductase